MNNKIKFIAKKNHKKTLEFFVEWFFRPCIYDYRGNWSEGYNNRMWICLAIICNPLTMAIVGICEKWLGLIPMVIMIGIFIINIVQQCLFEYFWKPPQSIVDKNK